MRKRFSLVQTFSLILLIGLAVFGIIMGWVITTTLERTALGRAEKTIAGFVTRETISELTPQDLESPAKGEEFERLDEKLQTLVFNPEVVRIKIWNHRGVVIWSTDSRLIGRKFDIDVGVGAAFQGRLNSEFTDLEDEEHHLERHFGRLMEIFVPIRFEGQKDVASVVEVYLDLKNLYEDINHQNRLVWGSLIVGLLLLYSLLFGVIWRAQRLINQQTEKLAASEEKYRRLVNSAHDGIISTDKTGRITLINQAAAESFLYSREELLGQPISTLIPEKYQADHEWAFEAFFSSEATRISKPSYEFEGQRRDGTTFPIEISLSTGGQGPDRVVTAILRDITERKLLQEQLIESARQSSISVVAGSIGHELNNAVTGLGGFAQLLAEDPDDRDLVMETVGVFRKQTQRLKLHAHNLKTLSKPVEPDLKPLDINEVADEVTEMLATSGLFKHLELIQQPTSGLPLVPGDEMLLEQVVRNLEINAAQAMMETSGSLTVSTGLAEDGRFVCLSVADTGPGIADEVLDKIYQPFMTTKPKEMGTGLGMFIVKEIVEQHHGKIDIRTSLGQGTTITISLPVEDLAAGS